MTKELNKLSKQELIEEIVRLRQAEKELYVSEKRIRNVLETINLVAISLDIQGKIIFANDFLCELTGWERKDIIGKDWFEYFIPPEITRELRDIVFIKQYL